MRKLVLLAVASLLVLAAACSDGPSADAGTGSRVSDGTSGAAADETLVDPIVAEEGVASCAFEFSEATLADRGFAFDGTVTSIDEPEAMDAPYVVGFEVIRWFAGGTGTTVELRTYDVSGTSLAGDLALAVGDRVLASGDDDFLWGCGFSTAYTDADASVFERAFA